MHPLFKELRYTLRGLRRSPAFLLTVIATLGIGIGLNAAIFTVVDCVLLRPLGYHDADRIVALQTHFDDENRSIPRLGGDDYNDLAAQVTGLEGVAHYQNFTDGAALHGNSLYVPVALVSPRFTEVMGVQPVAGRLFHPSDAGGTDVLISAAFARDHFPSPGAALGQSITYTGAVYTIVGVLPEGFSFPSRTELWFENAAKVIPASRTAYNDHAIGKRRAGVSPSQLNAELAAFAAQLRRTYPENRNKSLEALSLQQEIVGPIRPTLHLLMGAVAVILLIVCANVTHLQLARASGQLHAVSVRRALGASRSKLAAHALMETALLASAGAVAALLLAAPALRLLVRLAPPSIPRLADVHLNLDVMAFSLLATLGVMTLTALIPIWRSWHVDPALALRQDSSRSSESRRSLRLRNSFIVAEVALTLTLSVCALLLTRQLIAQSRQDLGFSPDTLITLDAHAVLSTLRPVLKSDTRAAQAAFQAEWEAISQANLARADGALATLAAIPGVESAAGIDGAPMAAEGGSNLSYAIKGRQVFAPGVLNLPVADLHSVTPGLFATMRIPLLRGRDLSPLDRSDSPPVLVINQELARTIFPAQDPVGQQIMCGYDEHSSWWTIVGVVGNVRSDSPATPPKPTFYVPVAQHAGAAPDLQFVVRTRIDPAAMAETLRKRLAQVHPEIAVQVSTMRENIGETGRADQFRTLLFGSFAAVSILLAAVGMYGVTAYTVSQRRFEFALRIAVGATHTQVLTLVLRKALVVALLGAAVGLALSMALTRLLGSVVGDLPPFDAPAYGLATLAVLSVAVLATLVPARAAASAEPMNILRGE